MVAPGTIVLTVFNRTAAIVPIMQLAVEVLAGPSTDHLAPIPPNFQLDIPSGWESTYQDLGLLFTPVSAPLSIEPGQALVFTFSALPASALVSALAACIHETSAAGTGIGIIPLASMAAPAFTVNEFIGRLFALSQAGNR